MGQNNFYKNIYCFEISLTDGSKLYLSSYDQIIETKTNSYYPYSGLQLTKAYFTDSLKDSIVLEGIFENLGINKNMELIGANIQIYIYNIDSYIAPLVSYYVTKVTVFDCYFNLILESEAIKYQQTIVKYYSNTCRANLGDNYCRVDLERYTIKTTIISYEQKILKIANIQYPNGYFDYGSVYTLDRIFISKILKHRNNELELLTMNESFVVVGKEVTLIAGCDKNFLTCCNKFNNAVNFRGEPFIPRLGFVDIGN